MLVPSRYNFEFGFEGRRFLYNLLSTSLVELTEDVFAKDIESIGKELTLPLVANGFLVDKDLNEKKKYELYFDQTRLGYASRILKVTLIPTYACNLACPYCYQGQNKQIKTIDFTGAERVLRFLDFAVAEGKKHDMISKVVVSLYGGEPMMNKDVLEFFCAGAHEIASDCELPIIFDMTTNLTLLDERMISLIKKYDIAVQVTIDGPKHFHDMKRIYRDGRGTFEDILSNLRKLKDCGLSKLVTIRINVDKDTIDYAEDAFLSVKDFSQNIYFAVIRHYKGANDCHKEYCVPEESYSSFIPRTNEILAKYGRRVYRQFGKKSPCTLITPNKYYIDCYFDVYGCDCLINHPECKIGTLNEDGHLDLTGFYYEQMQLAATRADKCKDCRWLPACGGGCPAEQYINSGKNDGKLEGQCMVDEDSLKNYLIDYVKRNEQLAAMEINKE